MKFWRLWLRGLRSSTIKPYSLVFTHWRQGATGGLSLREEEYHLISCVRFIRLPLRRRVQVAPKSRYLLHENAAKFSRQSDSNEMSTKHDVASRLNSYNLSFKGLQIPGRRARILQGDAQYLWLLKFWNSTHVWKICASLLVLIYNGLTSIVSPT
jgi:hypothetical protein